MRLYRLVLIGAAALTLAGCGAKDEAASGGAAKIVPASAPAYVAVKTDADSSQWRQIEKLLKKFPDGGTAIQMLRSSIELNWERDVKPALGDEIDLVWLDFKGQGENVVAVTKPNDKEKFLAAVKKDKANMQDGDTPLLVGELDDWLILSDSQAKIDRFKQQVPKGESLADDATYKDAVAELPEDSLVAAFARGRDLLQVIEDTALLPGGSLFQLQAGQRPEFVAAALAAQDEGMRLVTASRTEDSAAQAETFKSKLLADVPGDAVAFLAFRGGAAVDKQLEQLQGEAMAQDALEEFERMSGLKIDAITGLFKNEVALYVRAGSPFPEVTLLLEAPDEQAALRDVNRIISALSSTMAAQPCHVPVECTDLNGVEISRAAFDGKVVISTQWRSIEKIRSGGGSRLVDDDGFKSARKAVGMPDQTAGFVWLDFEDGLPIVLGLAKASGGSDAIPAEVRRNLEPLRSFVAWADVNGRTSSAELFLAID